jgi:hypothetical protein
LIADFNKQRDKSHGIYDLAANTGWVNVGIDNDTAAFAMHTIRRWRQDVGRVRYPLATRLSRKRERLGFRAFIALAIFRDSHYP